MKKLKGLIYLKLFNSTRIMRLRSMQAWYVRNILQNSIWQRLQIQWICFTNSFHFIFVLLLLLAEYRWEQKTQEPLLLLLIGPTTLTSFSLLSHCVGTIPKVIIFHSAVQNLFVFFFLELESNPSAVTFFCYFISLISFGHSNFISV